jgi:hypothetical protein
MAVRLSALSAVRPLLPGRFLLLISATGWANLKVITRLKGSVPKAGSSDCYTLSSETLRTEPTMNLLPCGVARLKTSRLRSFSCRRPSMSSCSEAMLAVTKTHITATCNTIWIHKHFVHSWGSRLQGCGAVYVLGNPAIRRNMSPPSSGQEEKMASTVIPWQHNCEILSHWGTMRMEATCSAKRRF